MATQPPTREEHVLIRLAMAPFRSRRLGYALVASFAAAFVLLATLVIVRESIPLAVDRPISEWVIEHRAPSLTEAFSWISLLGTRWLIVPLLAVLTGWMFATGRCRVIALVMIVAIIANPLLELLFKEVLVQRARPELVGLVPGRGASFPSGHVLASVGFYGMLPVLVSMATRRFWLRASAFVLAMLVILAIGYSRMYLGVHWFTDVIGAYLLATVVVLGTYEALGGHRLDETACGPHRPFGIGRRRPGRAARP